MSNRNKIEPSNSPSTFKQRIPRKPFHSNREANKPKKEGNGKPQKTEVQNMQTKKLHKKGKKVHPSTLIDDYLALLPSAILTLITALSDDDKRVLAYLISWSNKEDVGDNFRRTKNIGKNHINSHPFNCDCFECYTGFWASWNSSPNRQLIHDAIEAYEEDLAKKKEVKTGKMNKSRRNNNKMSRVCDEPRADIPDGGLVDESVHLRANSSREEEDVEVGREKGTFRRLLSFIGDNFSGLWNMG